MTDLTKTSDSVNMAIPSTHTQPATRKSSRAGYRVRQFVMSLRPQVAAEERALVAGLVPAPAVALFERMPLRDQRHSLDVLHALRGSGHDQPDLAAAALLHDVGKTVHEGRQLRLWHRVLIVLLDALNPGWVARLANPQPRSWRYPFYAHLHHPEQSAALALAAGCTPLTVELIRRHQRKLASAPLAAEDQLLAWLQAADDAN